MSTPFRIEVMGESQVHLGLGRVMTAMSDLSKPVGRGPSLWDRWRDAFYAVESELFKSEGGSGASGTWPELSDPYATWKQRHHPGQKILVASGLMRDSLTKPGFGVFEPMERQMFIGTERLAHYHWPRRKAIDISKSQEKAEFGRALTEWANDVRKVYEQS